LKTTKAFTNLIGVQNQNTKQQKRGRRRRLGILIYYKQNEHAKQIVGTNFVVEDSIPNIQWKITNEHREIAG
jgi:GLPGLI family protein